jgi:glycosyltransferase involved in cell wall biosynthesis
MKRVLLVHPQLNPPGGGNAVAAWTLEALRTGHRVALLTWDRPDLDAVNRHYGTSLRAGDFTCHGVAPWVRKLVPTSGLEMWRYNYLLRVAKRLQAQYDVVIGTHNEADFGCRGIQYIHFPRFNDPRVNPSVQRTLHAHAYRWYHRSPLLMAWYFRLCGLGGSFSMGRMRENLTLVNSDWTGRVFHDTHGVGTVTLYPPVASEFPDVPWEQREHGFVCIGRISPEKRLGLIVTILAAVRARGHDIHLHIIGVPDDPNYVLVVRRLQAEHADWVSLDLDLPHHELARLIASHRFGIHGMENEHFGIAVGEMVNAGCIVFVPGGGGQVEIIGDCPDLTYGSRDEAVDKIAAMLEDPGRQRTLRTHLAVQRQRFSTETFMQQMRSTVEHFQR